MDKGKEEKKANDIPKLEIKAQWQLSSISLFLDFSYESAIIARHYRLYIAFLIDYLLLSIGF